MKLTSCLLSLLFCIPCTASEEEAAARAVGRALYKQFKIEDSLNLFIKEQVPNDLKETATKVIIVVDIAVKNKVEMSWSF